ncbi:hypothetical protein [Inconstantimicrobium mannanitabidum]|uniref:Uncharacterized protein n=1 Tax=Inconstantimicrobium mannanitabidum TaxID=1604901 RepID=A0ACB5RF60_9CLOT|nr:hypothetical protein [Clostridium sp. TW13]GKX67487.1 hypothetical protein rsdtw13_27450 [Clostridium sp. TW13]
MKKEFMEILKVFEQAYVDRDCSKIDDFMLRLFDKEEDVVIVGTSSGEWCLGHEAVKDIFLSDWQYWGDVRLKPDKANIIELENTGLIYVPGTVKHHFNSKSETYTRYLGYVEDYFKEDCDDSKKPNKIKLAEINWMLTHLLSQRDTVEREYLWDVNISFILVKKSDRWIVKHMQFSIPVLGYLPDVRFYDGSDALGYFNEETKQLEEYCIKNNCLCRAEVLSRLESFNEEYLNKDKDINNIINKYFVSNNPLLININNNTYSTEEEIQKFIQEHRVSYDEVNLDCKNCLVSSNEEVAWVVTHGTMKKVTSEKESLKYAVDKIKSIFVDNMNDKEKLFKIRRSIADTFKEISKGEECIWPFRFEAVMVKESGNWVFKYFQYSLPFNIILEGKTDAAVLLEK